MELDTGLDEMNKTRTYKGTYETHMLYQTHMPFLLQWNTEIFEYFLHSFIHITVMEEKMNKINDTITNIKITMYRSGHYLGHTMFIHTSHVYTSFVKRLDIGLE